MMQNRTSSLFTFLFVLLFAATVLPLSAESLRFTGRKTEVVFAEGRERTVLSGQARVESDTTTITAGRIELYGDGYRYAMGREGVTVVDTERDFTLTSDTIFLDRDLDITRAEGNAVMENRKDELVIKGGFLENRKNEQLTIIQIGVRILREDMVARAEFARYREEEQILELSGMPNVYWKGDEYRATRIIINLDTDEIQLIGDVSGSIKNERQPSDEREQDSPAAGTSTLSEPEAAGAAEADTPPDRNSGESR